PDRLKQRYRLTELPPDGVKLIEEIGRRRGALGAGGVIDHEKAARLLIADMRSGVMGGICLEGPEQIQSEHAE
ncbi:MAG TPA: ribosome biogenesis GTPase YlqF, partial [Gammaproteobacteria bacterium]